MSEAFRFIHAADLHLGSFLNINGKSHDELQDLCKSAVYDGFERICNKAILYKVEFILLCGDIYDSHLRSVRGNKFFVDQCVKLSEKNIGVYVIYGNHDAINDAEELFTMPLNVHIFSSDKVETFEVFKGDKVIANIIGKSYKHRSEKEKTYKNYLLDNNVFNIGMLHTALDGDNKNYVPATMQDLKMVPNIDYWALGHIHKLNILNSTKPIVAFSGIPQGRDMGEQGIGGVFLVTVRSKEVTDMEFLPIATVVYKRVEIILGDDCTIENYNDLLGVIYNEVNALSYKLPDLIKIKPSNEELLEEFKGYIVRLTIKGRTDMHHKITHMTEDDYKKFLENINEEMGFTKHLIWVDSIIFRTSPIMQDFEALKMKNSIFQDLDEVISLYTTDIELKNGLVKNWGSIWNKQVYTEDLEDDKFDFDEETISDIISQARELLVEKLVEALEIM